MTKKTVGRNVLWTKTTEKYHSFCLNLWRYCGSMEKIFVIKRSLAMKSLLIRS